MIISPKVSILIPVYNRESIILETLSSAINQTYKNIEVIVVDNKSTDNTFSIIKDFSRKHPNVKAFQNEENIGPVRNWQRCLGYAEGEYAKFLWSDDLIAPTFIEKTLPFLTNHEDVGFVFTGTEIFNNETGMKRKAYFIGKTGIYDTKKFIEGSLLGGPFPVSPGNALFRRKDLEKNLLIDVPNKINSDFKMHAIGNDVLIYLLTAKDYPRFAFVNEALSYFRYHKYSITVSSNIDTCLFLYNIAKAFFVENNIIDEQLKNKFNTMLMISFLRYRNSRIIKRLRDYYNTYTDFRIDYIFLIKYIIKKIYYKILKQSPT